MEIVYPHMSKYYEYDMTDYEYPPPIQGGGLLHAINYHFGIKIKINEYPFFKKEVDVIFSHTHIQ